MKNLNDEIDIDNVTPSDFTIMVTNIPKSSTNKEIYKFFTQKSKHFHGTKVVKIV